MRDGRVRALALRLGLKQLSPLAPGGCRVRRRSTRLEALARVVRHGFVRARHLEAVFRDQGELDRVEAQRRRQDRIG
jgi:hypothetical protein